MITVALTSSKDVLKALKEITKKVSDASDMGPNIAGSLRDDLNRIHERIDYHIDRSSMRAARAEREATAHRNAEREEHFQKVADRLYNVESKSGGYPDVAAAVVMEQCDAGLADFDEVIFAEDFARRIEGVNNPMEVERELADDIQLSVQPPTDETGPIPEEEEMPITRNGEPIYFGGQDSAGGSVSGPGGKVHRAED
jgi:hypothetical protein